MKPSTNSRMFISTEINRCMFEGDVDGALQLIGSYMRDNGLQASIETVAAIPIKSVPTSGRRSVQ
jgi:hypothetical protein